MADITRDYWVEAIQEENVKFVEKIFAALNKETGCDFALNYTQSYICFGLNNKNTHMINVKQGKKGLRISIQVKQTAAIDSTLKSLAIDGDVTYGSDGWYVFFVTNKIDIDKLVSVLKQSAVERGINISSCQKSIPQPQDSTSSTTEIEAAKAEAEKVRIELERQKAETEAAKAELARVQEEAAKSKAEAEAIKATIEKAQAQDKNAEKEKLSDEELAKQIEELIYSNMVYVDATTLETTVTTYEGIWTSYKEHPDGDRRRKLVEKTEYLGCKDITLKIKSNLDEFLICKFLTSQKIWTMVMGNNPSSVIGDDYPVNNISLIDAQNFVNKLNRLTHHKYQFAIPTEYQWVWAAKGAVLGEGHKFAGNDYIDDVAWYEENSNNTLQKIAQKMPNELGIYDMCGLLSELCGTILKSTERKYDAQIGYYTGCNVTEFEVNGNADPDLIVREKLAHREMGGYFASNMASCEIERSKTWAYTESGGRWSGLRLVAKVPKDYDRPKRLGLLGKICKKIFK